MYKGCPHLDNPWIHVVFSRRFRMPYSSIQDFVSLAQDHALFERWREGKVDELNQPATPLPLLIFCALRYIGRGWTFDDLTENTGISEEIVRVFFHCFIKFGSTFPYRKYVVAPSMAEEASAHSYDYAQPDSLAALARAMPRTFVLAKVEYHLRQSHLDFKSSHTARSYNITVNHRQQILATTTGHPARWNDKTFIVLFDNSLLLYMKVPH